jgi:hypothetical protein
VPRQIDLISSMLQRPARQQDDAGLPRYRHVFDHLTEFSAGSPINPSVT